MSQRSRVGADVAALRGGVAQGAVARETDALAEVPLVEWASIALRAGRLIPFLPHMAWVVRFPDAIDKATIDAENVRLGSSPYGLGRRIARQRVPGGRPRWRACPQAPPVIYNDVAVGSDDELAAWVDSHMGIRLDPEYDAGWQMFVTATQAGGTAVLVIVHHLFGIATGLIDTLYGQPLDPSAGTTGIRFEDPANDYTLAAELSGLRERFTLGFRGFTQLAPAISEGRRKRRMAPNPHDPTPLKKPRGRDRTRRMMSKDRVAASAFVSAERWDGTAREWGGTGTTLATAVAANLLRRARQARSGQAKRPLQLIMPIDLTALEGVDRTDRLGAGLSAETTMTTANVVLPGGAPAHGDLGDIRARMRAAFAADALDAPAMRGVGDIARLLPEYVAMAAAARAAVSFDGCVSIVGELPAGMLRLADHEASHACMLGFPMGNEAITGLFRYRDMVSISVVTDPRRMGPNADLRIWLAEELGAWGLNDVVM